MRYFTSRQLQWPTGANVVEIAARGLNHSGPDMLYVAFEALGEGIETSDPREALEAAIAIRDAWNEQLNKDGLPLCHIEAGYNLDIITSAEEPTDEELREWARAEWEAAPIGKEDARFCSAGCAEQYWEEWLHDLERSPRGGETLDDN